MSLHHLRTAVGQLRRAAHTPFMVAAAQRSFATVAAPANDSQTALSTALQKYRTSLSTKRPVQLDPTERDAVRAANPQQLAGPALVEAVGILAAHKEDDEKILKQYAAAAEARLGELEPSDLSRLALSLAALKVNEPKVFAGVVQQQLGAMYKVDGPSVANTMWALASLSYSHDSYAHAATRHVRSLTGTLSAQEVSNLAWACTTMGLYDRHLFASLARRGIDTMASANFQALSNLLWSFAKMKDFNFELFGAAAKITRRHAQSFHPTDLARISWAFAEEKHNSKELFANLAMAAQAKMNTIEPRDLVILAEAFATLPTPPKSLFEGIRKRAIALWPTIGESERKALTAVYAKLNVERPVVTAATA